MAYPLIWVSMNYCIEIPIYVDPINYSHYLLLKQLSFLVPKRSLMADF